MIIKIKNVFCDPRFCGERYLNITYNNNCVEISDTKDNDICSLGVIKFTVTSKSVLFYFVKNGEIYQFFNGTISTDERNFEHKLCRVDKKELLQLSNEFNSCP